MKTRILVPIGLAVSAALFSGCVVTKYKDPSGAEFSRTSVLNRTNAGKVEMRAGDKVLKIEGYSNEQTELAAAVAGAVVDAVTKKTP